MYIYIYIYDTYAALVEARPSKTDTERKRRTGASDGMKQDAPRKHCSKFWPPPPLEAILWVHPSICKYRYLRNYLRRT